MQTTVYVELVSWPGIAGNIGMVDGNPRVTMAVLPSGRGWGLLSLPIPSRRTRVFTSVSPRTLQVWPSHTSSYCRWPVSPVTVLFYIKTCIRYSLKLVTLEGWWSFHGREDRYFEKVVHDDVIKWKHFPRDWPFVREFTGHRWIVPTKACDAELWCFLWSGPEWTVE